jgi:glycosyltransferase involved in cell wall biosynthesis
MKIALVHDYLIEYGGAERVLEALHEIFPEAPIYTAYLDLNGLGFHKEEIKTWNIKTSWMQHVPFARRLISPFRIFAAKTFESFDLSDYDVVISSCNTYFSKAVKTKPNTLNLSYIHTPPRYLYGFTTSFNYKKHWWTRIVGEVMNHFLRIVDFETSKLPNILIANSKNVQERINKFYRRESVVIYPPVEVERFMIKDLRLDNNKKEYFLSVSRLVRGKGVEVIVKACTKLNLPLKVVGSGPEQEYLKKIAGENVEFLGGVKDEELPQLYANAKALIVSSEDEDFGITAVESQAAGTPVIAVAAGGYLETVIDKKTGLFFDRATAESLMEVLQKFNSKDFKPEDCQKNAQKFSKERFKKEILDLVDRN